MRKLLLISISVLFSFGATAQTESELGFHFMGGSYGIKQGVTKTVKLGLRGSFFNACSH